MHICLSMSVTWCREMYGSCLRRLTCMGNPSLHVEVPEVPLCCTTPPSCQLHGCIPLHRLQTLLVVRIILGTARRYEHGMICRLTGHQCINSHSDMHAGCHCCMMQSVHELISIACCICQSVCSMHQSEGCWRHECILGACKRMSQHAALLQCTGLHKPY